MEFKNQDEYWKGIQDYPYYLILSYGRVLNISNMKIKKLKTHKNGYLNCIIKNSTDKKTFLVHRLAANAFLEIKEKCSINFRK